MLPTAFAQFTGYVVISECMTVCNTGNHLCDMLIWLCCFHFGSSFVLVGRMPLFEKLQVFQQ